MEIDDEFDDIPLINNNNNNSNRPKSSIRPFTAKFKPQEVPTNRKDSARFDIDLNNLSDKDEKNIQKLDFFKNQTKKLEKIELAEKNAESAYNWKTLFSSKPRPTTSKNISINNIFSRKSIEDFAKKRESIPTKNFVFPLALINEHQEKLKDFITIQKEHKRIVRKDKLSENKNNEYVRTLSSYQSDRNFRMVNEPRPKGNSIRPQSVYSKRLDTDVFYTNNAINDYFTQSFKEFATKFKPLQPKFPVHTKKIRTTLENIHRNKDKYSHHSQDLEFYEPLLNLANRSGKIDPLIKSLLRDGIIEGSVEDVYFQEKKNYFNSNKPLSSSTTRINYKENIRDLNMMKLKNEIMNQTKKEVVEENSKLLSSMKLEEYDENDPCLNILNISNSKVQDKNQNEILKEMFEDDDIEFRNKNQSENLFTDLQKDKINQISEKSFKIENVNSNNNITTTAGASSKANFINYIDKVVSTNNQQIDEISESEKTSNFDNFEMKTQSKFAHTESKFFPKSNTNTNRMPRPNTSKGYNPRFLKTENYLQNAKESLSKNSYDQRPKSSSVSKQQFNSNNIVQTSKKQTKQLKKINRPTTAKIGINQGINLVDKYNQQEIKEIKYDIDTHHPVNINNLYFNDFIDFKFRPLNQNFGRFQNSYKREELNSALRRNKIVDKDNRINLNEQLNFNDLMKVENYKSANARSQKSKPKSAVLKPSIK